MLKLDNYTLILSDMPAGGGATLDLYFDPQNGLVLEDKTLSDGTHLLAEAPIDEALDDLTDDQIVEIAEIILSQCSRNRESRPMSEANKAAFDKLVAEMHHDLHEFQEIKEAIADYYN